MSAATLDIQIDTTRTKDAIAQVARVRSALTDRRGLHAEIAGEGERLTRSYLRGLSRHKTAERLGAEPTQHLAAAARGVESESDGIAARVLIPRSSGLYRAFTDFLIRPGSGKTYLTIPADRRTYGRRAGEFDLAFTIVGGRYPALVFRESGEVAFWLRHEVEIPQDRTLLPSGPAYGVAMRGASARYFRRVLKPKGGTA